MDRPNLLFLYTDEQRADTLAAHGGRVDICPNLNRLAEDATVFENTYCTHPLCVPSRSSIHSGQFPHTTGCTYNGPSLRPDTKCLPEMLEGNYMTAHMGKWHLGDEVFNQHGFTEWHATEDCYHKGASLEKAPDKRSAYHHWLMGHGFYPDAYNGTKFDINWSAWMPERYSKPQCMGDLAIEFLERNKENPFALFVSFQEPHMPFHSCRDDQFDPAEVELPPNHNDENLISARARKLAESLKVKCSEGLLKSEQDWREMTARYWGLCSLIDTHSGRILDKLKELGLYDNTIIIFTSDHGEFMGSHGMLLKSSPYEESARVPFLMRLPGQAEARRVKEPISQIDLVPTMLDCMGSSIPDHLHGVSLKPAVEGTAVPDRDVVVEFEDQPKVPAEEKDPWRCIVTPDRWKLTVSPNLGEHSLFDLNTDPYELNNLINEPGRKERINDMADRLRQWQKETDDTVTLPEQII